MNLYSFLGTGHPQNEPEYRKSHLPNSTFSTNLLTHKFDHQSPLINMNIHTFITALFITKVAHPWHRSTCISWADTDVRRWWRGWLRWRRRRGESEKVKRKLKQRESEGGSEKKWNWNKGKTLTPLSGFLSFDCFPLQSYARGTLKYDYHPHKTASLH